LKIENGGLAVGFLLMNVAHYSSDIFISVFGFYFIDN